MMTMDDRQLKVKSSAFRKIMCEKFVKRLQNQHRVDGLVMCLTTFYCHKVALHTRYKETVIHYAGCEESCANSIYRQEIYLLIVME